MCDQQDSVFNALGQSMRSGDFALRRPVDRTVSVAGADWSILVTEDTIAEMATAAASLLDAETFSASRTLEFRLRAPYVRCRAFDICCLARQMRCIYG